MRVAVIGGGAAGLATAWLLDPAHEVTLFEAAPVLGGHVRTVGGNVSYGVVDPGVPLDAGVIEFDRRTFTRFHGWMDALGVRWADLTHGGSTSLYLADGRHLHAPRAIAIQREGPLAEALDAARLVPAILRRRRFFRRVGRMDAGALARASMGEFFGEDDFSTWVRALLMYAYSMPYDEVASLSAAIAVPMLRDMLQDARWTRIPGGVYRYVQAARRALGGRVFVGCPVRAVRRETSGVVIERDGGRERFDAVVIATPPHRVLGLLADASDEERGWFGDHHGGEITTVLHTDTEMYARRGARGFTEFDLFERQDGGHGYNAYLNRLAGLDDRDPPHHSLAFDMDAEIDPAKVLHRQRHDVARYTGEALATRARLIAGNGQRRTYFAGAFLGDGLHEGAVRSAVAVSERLGGRHAELIARGDHRP